MALPIVKELRELRGDYRLHCTLCLASNEIEEQLTIGFNRRSLEILGEEIDVLLAKIGGDA